MAYVLTPGVESEITRTFKTEDVEYVRRRLSETELPWDSIAPPPRVHIAILWLARGDKQKFERELGGACCDWRDTLMDAGLSNENWRDVLARRGVDLTGIES